MQIYGTRRTRALESHACVATRLARARAEIALADVLAVCSLTSTTATSRAPMSKRPAAAGDAPSKQAKVATSEPGLPNLLPPHWKNEIARYLEVDMPKWDVGGFVVGDAPHHAMLLGKAPGVLAGVPFARPYLA